MHHLATTPGSCTSWLDVMQAQGLNIGVRQAPRTLGTWCSSSSPPLTTSSVVPPLPPHSRRPARPWCVCVFHAPARSNNLSVLKWAFGKGGSDATARSPPAFAQAGLCLRRARHSHRARLQQQRPAYWPRCFSSTSCSLNRNRTTTGAATTTGIEWRGAPPLPPPPLPAMLAVRV